MPAYLTPVSVACILSWVLYHKTWKEMWVEVVFYVLQGPKNINWTSSCFCKHFKTWRSSAKMSCPM